MFPNVHLISKPTSPKWQSRVYIKTFPLLVWLCAVSATVSEKSKKGPGVFEMKLLRSLLFLMDARKMRVYNLYISRRKPGSGRQNTAPVSAAVLA